LIQRSAPSLPRSTVIIVNDASPTIANETSMTEWPILQSQVMSQATIVVAGQIIDEHQNEDHQPLVDSAPWIIHDESDNPSQTPADTCSPPGGDEKNSIENENQGNQRKAKQLDWTFLENGQLFGRQREIESVEQALERRLKPNAKPELILISGSSGTGKTVLARKLQKPVEEKGGFFVMGKFDQLKRPEPYAPLVAAMTAFAMHILGNGVEVVAETREAILESVGDDIGVLTAS
jgi:ABC-type glutathione transport system ATPase component